MLEPATKCRLLSVARAALEAQVRGEVLPAVPPDLAIPVDGVFVSIHDDRDDLRGCLGTLEGDESLGDAVVRLAAAVCHEDIRFSPVPPEELPRLIVEISVLGPRRPIVDVAEIEVGRHGLTVERGSCRGLLLPQVATDFGWDAQAFLEHACRKAALPSDAWCTGADVCIFEAEIFSEAWKETGG